MRTTLIICAMTVFGAFAYSQPIPAPSPNHGKAETPNTKASEPKPFSSAPKIALPQPHPGDNQNRAEEAKSHGSSASLSSWEKWGEKFREDPIVLFTLVLAISTIFLGLDTRGLRKAAQGQSKDTREALDIAKEAADAAKLSANTASASLVITQRAWLTAKEFRGRAIQDGAWKFSVVFENGGNTPAQRASGGAAAVQVERGTQFLGPFVVTPTDKASIVSLGPRATFNGTHIANKDEITTDQVRRMLAKEIDVFLCGRVDYADIFPDSPARYTTVCMKVLVEDPTLSRRPHPFGFEAHYEYNEAT